MSILSDRFVTLCNNNGSAFLLHREDGGTVCPCVTDDGFRDPQWHEENPEAPVCNEMGMLDPEITEINAKGFIQPVTAFNSLEPIQALIGEVEADDHVGILPVTWSGNRLEFQEWDDRGAHYIVYNDDHYSVVNASLVPDPSGFEEHHFEVGLRLIRTERPNAPPDS